MYFDTISDFLTRVRNAQMARHRMVDIPASNVKKRITEILYDKGYILKYKFDEEDKKGTQGTIKIALKYDAFGEPVMKNISRYSKPGKREYRGSENIPHTLNGLGISIISTSKGIMTDKEARKLNIGGEVLCQVY